MAALPFIVGATLVVAPAANADPFTCPGNQTSQKVDGQWTCVNSAGNTNNSEDPRNPNKNKL
jgi:hypothetical protein